MATELKRPAVLSAVFKIRTDRSEEIIKTSRCIGNRNKSMRKFALKEKSGLSANMTQESSPKCQKEL